MCSQNRALAWSVLAFLLKIEPWCGTSSHFLVKIQLWRGASSHLPSKRKKTNTFQNKRLQMIPDPGILLLERVTQTFSPWHDAHAVTVYMVSHNRCKGTSVLRDEVDALLGIFICELICTLITWRVLKAILPLASPPGFTRVQDSA